MSLTSAPLQTMCITPENGLVLKTWRKYCLPLYPRY